jgi:hypothetical protein
VFIFISATDINSSDPSIDIVLPSINSIIGTSFEPSPIKIISLLFISKLSESNFINVCLPLYPVGRMFQSFIYPSEFQ